MLNAWTLLQAAKRTVNNQSPSQQAGIHGRGR